MIIIRKILLLLLLVVVVVVVLVVRGETGRWWQYLLLKFHNPSASPLSVCYKQA